MTSMVMGGTGFIASRLVRRLLDQGEQVVVFDISANFGFIADVLGKIDFVQGDITNLNEIIDAIKVHSVQHIYNLAALLSVVCEVVPVRAAKVNGLGMVNVLEACRLMDVERILFTSSLGVFGDLVLQGAEIYDDSPKYPITPYGALKLLGELYGLWYYRTYGLDFRAVRFPLVYGAGFRYDNPGYRMIESAALGKPVEIPHAAENFCPVLYVRDAVEAVNLVLSAEEEKVKKRVYNIEGVNCSFQELADTVRKFIPDAVIRFAPTGGSSLNCKGYGTYLRQELGWKPSYSLEEGVKETIYEIKKDPNLYSKGWHVKDRQV